MSAIADLTQKDYVTSEQRALAARRRAAVDTSLLRARRLLDDLTRCAGQVEALMQRSQSAV